LKGAHGSVEPCKVTSDLKKYENKKHYQGGGAFPPPFLGTDQIFINFILQEIDCT